MNGGAEPAAAVRFALACGAVAVVALAAVLAIGMGRPGPWLHWALWGWVVGAVPGVIGGTWQFVEHGRVGARFFAALVATMLTRLVGVGIGVGFASTAGRDALVGFLVGVVLGYLPVQGFEVSRFMHRGGRPGIGRGSVA